MVQGLRSWVVELEKLSLKFEKQVEDLSWGLLKANQARYQKKKINQVSGRTLMQNFRRWAISAMAWCGVES